MKTSFSKTLSLSVITLGIALTGCRAQNNEATDLFTSDAQADTLESGITMLQGMADDASGSSFAYQSVPSASKFAVTEKLLFSTAEAANCGRAVSQVCNVGVKSITYSGCQIGSAFSLSGDVTLTFSNNSCDLSIGENVVRTYEHTISGPRGGAIQTTSDLRSDYRGTQIGGGGRLTRTGANEWTAEILGKHKVGTRGGRTLFDVSVKTSSPIAISGALGRSGRTVNSGVLEVNHNRAGFTALYSVVTGQPLVWNSSCAHPVSGQLAVSYSGSINGSGTVTFTGCGIAQLSKDGSARTLSIGYAE